MQHVRSAAFLFGIGLYLVFASSLNGGEPLHLRTPISATTVARKHRKRLERGMAVIVSVYRSEESVPIQAICATYHTHPTRARRGENGGPVAH
jgi:hypothetical protein